MEEGTPSKLASVPAGSGRVNGGEVISHSEYRARGRERKSRLLSAHNVFPQSFLPNRNRIYIVF